jgi:hypothetical protein
VFVSVRNGQLIKTAQNTKIMMFVSHSGHWTGRAISFHVSYLWPCLSLRPGKIILLLLLFLLLLLLLLLHALVFRPFRLLKSDLTISSWGGLYFSFR